MKLKFFILLLVLHYQYLVGVVVAFGLLAIGATMYDVLEAILIWFFLVSMLKLLELRPLVEKFSIGHRRLIKDLAKMFERVLKTWGLLFSILTALVLYLWQVGATNIGIAVTWLFLLVLTIQMVLWHQTLNDVGSHGNLGFSALAISLPTLASIGYISAELMLAAGVPRLLDFAIVFGVPGAASWLLYNLIGYFSLITPEEIQFTHDLRERLNKLRELKLKCLELRPTMFAQGVIPSNADVIPILKGEKCYFGIVNGKHISFLDVGKKTSVRDKVVLSKLELTLNLKNKIGEIPQIKQWSSGKIMSFFVHSRVAVYRERLIKGYIKFDKLPISAHKKKIEKEMFRSDFEMWVKVNILNIKTSKVRNILIALDEAPSVDLATELCKEAGALDKSVKEFAITLKKREKLWKEYVGQTRLMFVMPGPDVARKSIAAIVKWLAPILEICGSE